tara:strand:- start:211 stop:1458 length:1248 start_codon:yes stop_codon:yes gene_type:complete
MATIRLKKRAATGAAGAPSSLAPSEVAFNEADKKLYYGFGDAGDGSSSSVISIAGEGAVMHLGNVNQTAAGNKTFSGNLTVGGNLTVNGTTSTLNSTNSVVADKIIELGNGTSGAPSGDSGIVIERGSSSNAFMGWDESSDQFVMGTGSFTGASTGNLTITKGTLNANIVGDVTGTVTGGISGNAATATRLQTARTIAGVSFDGTANISLNNNSITNGAGYINGSGNAGTATALQTARTIAGVSFDGTQNISLNNNSITNGAGYVTSSIIGSLNASNLSSGTVPDARLPGTITSNITGSSASCTGNSATATKLASARTIGGVSFDGSANINLPGVNTAGSQNTSGNAATATVLATARTIAGVSFNGSANISLNNNSITNGAGYVTSSIINSLNASNLSSGTVAAARIGTVDGGTF